MSIKSYEWKYNRCNKTYTVSLANDTETSCRIVTPLKMLCTMFANLKPGSWVVNNFESQFTFYIPCKIGGGTCIYILNVHLDLIRLHLFDDLLQAHLCPDHLRSRAALKRQEQVTEHCTPHTLMDQLRSVSGRWSLASSVPVKKAKKQNKNTLVMKCTQ